MLSSRCCRYICIVTTLITVCTAQDDKLNGPRNNPGDRPMLLGDTKTLTCSIRPGEEVPTVAWLERTADDGDAIIFVGNSKIGGAKHSNFELSSDGGNQWDLVINNVEAEDGGMYICQDTATRESDIAERFVEKSATSITLTEESTEVNKVTVTECVPSNIVCTSLSSIPIIDIIWTQQNGDLSGDITSAASQTNTTNLDESSDSVSTLQYTFSREYNGGTLTCRTSGQQLAAPVSDSAELNVQYVPEVVATYGGDMVTCTYQANPAVTLVIVIVNGTEEFNPTCEGTVCTLPLKVDYDTHVRCKATNSIGTGTATTVAIPGAPPPTTAATTELPTAKGITKESGVNHPINVAPIILGVFLVISIICNVASLYYIYRLLKKNNGSPKAGVKESSTPNVPQTYMELNQQTRQPESTYEQPKTNDLKDSETAHAYMDLNPHTRDEKTAYQDLNPTEKSLQGAGNSAYEEIQETKNTQAYVNVKVDRPQKAK